MDSHTHAECASIWPGMCSKCALRLPSGLNGVLDAAKGDEEGISLGIDLVAAMVGERLTQEVPVVVKRHRVPVCAQFLEQLS